MERFAIKIDKSLRANLYKICRLCGIDNPDKVKIRDEVNIVNLEDGEPELWKKILDCIGLMITKDDKMPQYMCTLCVDKINDFFEFREMCYATDGQTRKLLGIKDEPKLKITSNLASSSTQCKNEEQDIKEPIPTPQRSGRKRRNADMDICNLSTEIKKDDPDDIKPSSESNISSASKKKRLKLSLGEKETKVEPGSSKQGNTTKTKTKNENEAPTKLGLSKKRLKVEPTQKDKKELKLTKMAKKKVKIEVPPVIAPETSKKSTKKVDIKSEKPKRGSVDSKIKDETSNIPTSSNAPPVPPPIKPKAKLKDKCTICTEAFLNKTLLDKHIKSSHIPTIYRYHCVQCNETLKKNMEIKNHNLWHKLSKTPFQCGNCGDSSCSIYTYTKHIRDCGQVAYLDTHIPDWHCPDCSKKFETTLLFNMHSCVSKTLVCPGCDRTHKWKDDYLKHIPTCSEAFHRIPPYMTSNIQVKNEAENPASPLPPHQNENPLPPTTCISIPSTPTSRDIPPLMDSNQCVIIPANVGLLEKVASPSPKSSKKGRGISKKDFKRYDKLLKSTMALVVIKQEQNQGDASVDDEQTTSSDVRVISESPSESPPSSPLPAADDFHHNDTSDSDDGQDLSQPVGTIKQEIVDESYRELFNKSEVNIKNEVVLEDVNNTGKLTPNKNVDNTTLTTTEDQFPPKPILKLKITKEHGTLNSILLDIPKSEKKKKKKKRKEDKNRSPEKTGSHSLEEVATTQEGTNDLVSVVTKTEPLEEPELLLEDGSTGIEDRMECDSEAERTNFVSKEPAIDKESDASKEPSTNKESDATIQPMTELESIKETESAMEEEIAMPLPGIIRIKKEILEEPEEEDNEIPKEFYQTTPSIVAATSGSLQIACVSEGVQFYGGEEKQNETIDRVLQEHEESQEKDKPKETALVNQKESSIETETFIEPTSHIELEEEIDIKPRLEDLIPMLQIASVSSGEAAYEMQEKVSKKRKRRQTVKPIRIPQIVSISSGIDTVPFDSEPEPEIPSDEKEESENIDKNENVFDFSQIKIKEEVFDTGYDDKCYEIPPQADEESESEADKESEMDHEEDEREDEEDERENEEDAREDKEDEREKEEEDGDEKGEEVDEYEKREIVKGKIQIKNTITSKEEEENAYIASLDFNNLVIKQEKEYIDDGIDTNAASEEEEETSESSSDTSSDTEESDSASEREYRDLPSEDEESNKSSSSIPQTIKISAVHSEFNSYKLLEKTESDKHFQQDSEVLNLTLKTTDDPDLDITVQNRKVSKYENIDEKAIRPMDIDEVIESEIQLKSSSKITELSSTTNKIAQVEVQNSNVLEEEATLNKISMKDVEIKDKSISIPSDLSVILTNLQSDYIDTKNATNKSAEMAGGCSTIEREDEFQNQNCTGLLRTSEIVVKNKEIDCLLPGVVLENIDLQPAIPSNSLLLKSQSSSYIEDQLVHTKGIEEVPNPTTSLSVGKETLYDEEMLSPVSKNDTSNFSFSIAHQLQVVEEIQPYTSSSSDNLKTQCNNNISSLDTKAASVSLNATKDITKLISHSQSTFHNINQPIPERATTLESINQSASYTQNIGSSNFESRLSFIEDQNTVNTVSGFPSQQIVGDKNKEDKNKPLEISQCSDVPTELVLPEVPTQSDNLSIENTESTLVANVINPAHKSLPATSSCYEFDEFSRVATETEVSIPSYSTEIERLTQSLRTVTSILNVNDPCTSVSSDLNTRTVAIEQINTPATLDDIVPPVFTDLTSTSSNQLTPIENRLPVALSEEVQNLLNEDTAAAFNFELNDSILRARSSAVSNIFNPAPSVSVPNFINDLENVNEIAENNNNANIERELQDELGNVLAVAIADDETDNNNAMNENRANFNIT